MRPEERQALKDSFKSEVDTLYYILGIEGLLDVLILAATKENDEAARCILLSAKWEYTELLENQ